jgi:hypothetical protein
MLFQSFGCTCKVSFTGEMLTISLIKEYQAFTEYTLCVPVFLSDQSELISVATWSEIFWSLWGSCEPAFGFACFGEVRNTKPGITTPWLPVCCILHQHKWISSHMMGDVVLGGKLPHQMSREFSWLMAQQRAWGVFVVTNRNTSCPPKCGFQIDNWQFYGTGQKCIPSWTLKKLMKETGGEDRPSEQKILPGDWHTRG